MHYDWMRWKVTPLHTYVYLTLEAFKNYSCCDHGSPLIRSRRERGSELNAPRRGKRSQEENQSMNMELSRRHFLVGAGAGLAGTTLGALGFADIEAAHAAAIRPYKLAQTREARTICPYCAVSCGMLVFSAKADDGKMRVTHIEGDADHPVNRGTLCPKG